MDCFIIRLKIVLIGLFYSFGHQTIGQASQLVGSQPIEFQQVETQHFVIITPSYNNKRWYKKNLDSILSQRYPYYRVIYIDDASPDNTGKLVERYLKENDKYNRVQLIKNKKQRGQLANVYQAVHSCRDDEVVVIVDGDDWLINSRVLKKINQVYQDRNWLTYGQFKRYSPGNKWLHNSKGFASPVSKKTIENNSFRKHPWVFTHVRTFKSWLFKQINLKDLLNGNYYYLAATDVATMIPMLEMAGARHQCIREPLYVYNIKTLNKTKAQFQKKLEKKIKTLKPYDLLNYPVRIPPVSLDIFISSENEKQCDVLSGLCEQARIINHIQIFHSNAELLQQLKSSQENETTHILIVNSEISFNKNEFNELTRFMKISHADICYFNASHQDVTHVGTSSRYLTPNFYTLGRSLSEDKIMSKKFVKEFLKNFNNQGDVLKKLISTDSFYYIRKE